ncbi:YicC/YloC family endoribonuclease [Paludisphaera mucosa]|uniref:YicC family protein n=1 Tax=Paludisphaera mucosa TaxID=3030827 RepID=A0ABT6F404_9BACT|nr:YicC/YloC family endoribonuclease [Paludisphaera mucosa]MDG3002317.1 YicC family protein [Paludisphaera mucosa]
MLLSMTGFGEARAQEAGLAITAEVRSVNNRHLKISAKINDPYGRLEPELEQLAREYARRGTVQVSVRIERPRKVEDYRLNQVALASYREQLERLGGGPVDLGALLGLPGIVEEFRTAAPDVAGEWPVIARVATEALKNFEAARAREGAAMAAELLALVRSIRESLARVADRAPLLVQSYQKRLTERVQALVQEYGVAIDAKDLIREVAILADRSDVSEELVRLRAHLEQYEEILDGPESGGRKLEFVVQEMGREVNTVGSKSNDVEISRIVVEIKGVLERIRELVQNVE